MQLCVGAPRGVIRAGCRALQGYESVHLNDWSVFFLELVRKRRSPELVSVRFPLCAVTVSDACLLLFIRVVYFCLFTRFFRESDLVGLMSAAVTLLGSGQRT